VTAFRDALERAEPALRVGRQRRGVHSAALGRGAWQPDGERQCDGGDAGHGAGLGDGATGLLTGDALGASYPKQEEWETDYEFVPRIDGIPTGNTANVRLYRVNFQFGEILPLYPAPAT